MSDTGKRVKILTSTGMVHGGTMQADGTALSWCGATFPGESTMRHPSNITCGACWHTRSLPHEAFEAHPTPARPVPVSPREVLDLTLGALMRERPGGRPNGRKRMTWPERLRD